MCNYRYSWYAVKCKSSPWFYRYVCKCPTNQRLALSTRKSNPATPLLRPFENISNVFSVFGKGIRILWIILDEYLQGCSCSQSEELCYMCGDGKNLTLLRNLGFSSPQDSHAGLCEKFLTKPQSSTTESSIWKTENVNVASIYHQSYLTKKNKSITSSRGLNLFAGINLCTILMQAGNNIAKN